jgi:hypothetical protein
MSTLLLPDSLRMKLVDCDDSETEDRERNSAIDRGMLQVGSVDGSKWAPSRDEVMRKFPSQPRLRIAVYFILARFLFFMMTGQTREEWGADT